MEEAREDKGGQGHHRTGPTPGCTGHPPEMGCRTTAGMGTSPLTSTTSVNVGSKAHREARFAERRWGRGVGRDSERT